MTHLKISSNLLLSNNYQSKCRPILLRFRCRPASVRSSTSSRCPNNKRQRVEPIRLISSNSGSESSGSSLTTITTDLSVILQQFECCVCLEHITPPILQCPNAHLFCESCRQRFRTPVKCPQCRESLPNKDSRCYPLEQIAVDLGLQFPCKYSSSGCSVGSVLTEKKNHENHCEYQPLKCLEECEWSGDKKRMVRHLIDDHFYDIHDLNSHNLVIKLLDYNSGFDLKSRVTVI